MTDLRPDGSGKQDEEDEEEGFVLKLVAPLCGVLALIVILVLLYCLLQKYWNDKTQPAALPEGGLDNCGQPADEDEDDPDYETLTTLTTVPPALPPRNPDSISTVGVTRVPSSAPSSITGYSSKTDSVLFDSKDHSIAETGDVSLSIIRHDQSGEGGREKDHFRGSGLLEGVDAYHRHIPGGAPAEDIPEGIAPPPPGNTHHRQSSLEDDYMVPIRANLNDYVIDPMAAIQAKKGITEYMQKV